MISVSNKVALAWYQLLKDNISVPVYRTNVPKSVSGDYVLIRKESESEEPVKSIKWTKPVIVVEIVTRHQNTVEDETAGEIDNEITQLYSPGFTNDLPGQDGIQIINVYKQGTTFLDEYDGSEYLYRHITRYSHDIFQK